MTKPKLIVPKHIWDGTAVEKQKKELDKDVGKPKYIEVGIGGKKFWTTGELLAQAQDFERLVARSDVDMRLQVFGQGMVPALWENMQAQREISPTFASYVAKCEKGNDG